MEIVINNCYGGFGLSPKGVKYYLSLIGKELFLYKVKKFGFEDGGAEYVKASEPDDTSSLLLQYSTKDLGDIANVIPDEDFFNDMDIERTDPNLIKTVRDLGRDANGMCADLKIINIPDGTDYVISEYDGNEQVEERHRFWC